MTPSGKEKPKNDIVANRISQIMANFICNTIPFTATLMEDNFVHHFYICTQKQ